MKLKRVAGIVGLAVLIAWQGFAVYEWGAERVQTNLAALTMAAAVWFVAVFAREPWHRSWFGRSLMLIAVALFLSSLATVLFRTFGEYPYRGVLLVVSGDIALAAMVIRTLVLIGARRRSRGSALEEQLH